MKRNGLRRNKNNKDWCCNGKQKQLGNTNIYLPNYKK